MVAARAPELDEARRIALARVAGGRLDRLARLLDPHAARRRGLLLAQARAAYLEPGFEPSDAAGVLLESARERGVEAKELEEVKVQGLELPTREAEQRLRPPGSSAREPNVRGGLLAGSLEELAGWYRDLVVVGVGAEAAAAHVDMLDELSADATRERLLGAERAAEAVRATWRRLEEFQLAPQLALEALFVEVARELRS